MSGTSAKMEIIDRWQRLQKTLHEKTGLEIALYTEGGELVGQVSGEDPFCQELRHGREAQACRAFCRGIVVSTVQQDKTQYFRCPHGQLVFVMPVCLASGERLVVVGGKHFCEMEDDAKVQEAFPGAGPGPVRQFTLEQQAAGSSKLEPVVRMLEEALTECFAGPASNKGGQGPAAMPTGGGEGGEGGGEGARTPGGESSGGGMPEEGPRKDRYGPDAEEPAGGVMPRRKMKGQMAFLESVSVNQQDRTLAELADSLLGELCEMFGIQAASVMLTDDKNGPLSTSAFYGSRQDTGLLSDDSFCGEIDRWHKGGGGTFFSEERTDLMRMGLPGAVTSLLSVPLVSGGKVFGSVNFFNAKLDYDELSALKTNAGLMAMVLENRRLRGSINHTVGSIKGLCELSASLLGQRDTEELFKFVLEKSTELLQAEQGSLMLLNEQTEELAIKFSKGLDEELTRRLRLKSGQGIAGQVASMGEPLIVSDIENDMRLWNGTAKNRSRYKTKSFICIPLKIDNKVVGVLNVSDKSSGGAFSQTDVDLVSTIAAQVSVALERSVYQRQKEEFRRLSITDPLTSLMNRRYFSGRLAEEFERSKRYGHKLSLAMIDVDDFKVYNDKHGHKAGDEVLVELSGLIKASIRSHDVIARYGGEEFTLILPETDNATAKPLVDRIRATVSEHRFPWSGKLPDNKLTISVGLASFPEDAIRPEELLDNADFALYQAKRRGKNAVVNYRAFSSKTIEDANGGPLKG